VLGLLSALSLLGFPETIIRHWSHRGFASTFFRRALFTSSGAAVLFFLAYVAWLVTSQSAEVSPVILWSSVIVLVGSVATSLINAGLLALGRSELIVLITVAAGLTKLTALSIGLGGGVDSILLSFATGSVVSTTLAYGLLVISCRNARFPTTSENRTEREVRRFALSNWLSGSASLVPVSLAYVVLLERGGATAVAHATIPLLLLPALNLPASSIARSVFVSGSRGSNQSHPLIVRSGIIAAVLSSAIAVGVVLVGPVFYVIVKPEYAIDGVQMLNWLALACCVAVPNYFIDTYFNVKHRYREFAICNIGGTVLQVVAIVVLTISPTSLGQAWLIGQLAYLSLAIGILGFHRRRESRSTKDLRL
jgi:O-antigen/teichoic acid export membrane protein